jgi:hypothetical protein
VSKPEFTMAMSPEEFRSANAIHGLRELVAGLLAGRSAQMKRDYPGRVEDFAELLPGHAAALTHAAFTLRQAEDLLHVAEEDLSRVLRATWTTRRSETDSPVSGDVVH